MLLEENQISFHSKDGLIYDGVKDYSHQIAEMIGLGSDTEFYQAGVSICLNQKKNNVSCLQQCHGCIFLCHLSILFVPITGAHSIGYWVRVWKQLMEHIKLFSTCLNIPLLIRACDEQPP